MFPAHTVLSVKYTVHDLLPLSGGKGRALSHDCQQCLATILPRLLLLMSPSALVHDNMSLLSFKVGV